MSKSMLHLHPGTIAAISHHYHAAGRRVEMEQEILMPEPCFPCGFEEEEN